ncbi:MAG: non-canonical purine NTP pyrophosphatase, partial [Gammaproteobacteria bacterium]
MTGHTRPSRLQTTRVVMASSNPGKLREINQILAGLGMEIVPQSEFDVPDADETGLSFVENAILKARHAAQLTGLPAIADDSGLEVDALKGAPGIYSARYSSRSGGS